MHAPPHLPGSYLVVELTNRCSLACVHCSVSEGAAHPHHAATGFVDPRMVEALYADLATTGARFDALVMFWLGEPLLHPWFTRLWRGALRIAVRHGTFAKVEVHSNATHLDGSKVRAMLNDGPIAQPLHLSLDAVGRETYRAIKGMDRLARVEANVVALLEGKARTGARWPRPVFQLIVGRDNVGEAARFRERWEAECSRLGLPVRAAAGAVPEGTDAVVFFRQLDCPTPDQQAATNQVFAAEMARQGLALPPTASRHEGLGAALQDHATCSGFWKTPVVGWQGDVTTCTRDNLLENAVGNLRDHRFTELWWGPGMRDRRRRVAGGDYGGLDGCRTCFIPRSLNYSELAADEIAVQARWDRAAG